MGDYRGIAMDYMGLWGFRAILYGTIGNSEGIGPDYMGLRGLWECRAGFWGILWGFDEL